MEKRSLIQRVIARPEFGPFVLLVVEIAVFGGINPDFLSLENISNTLAFSPTAWPYRDGDDFAMTAGEFDLSVGSLFGFSPVLMWTLFNSHTTSMPVAFAIALVIAALIGWFNGQFVTRLKIPSFLVTLGMLLVVRGVALFVTDGSRMDLERRGAAAAPIAGPAVSSACSASMRRCSGSPARRSRSAIS